MIAVLTGDIVHSRSKSSEIWLPKLTETLMYFGGEGADWETFQGDSFQLRIAPDQAMTAAFHIKAALKTIQLDIRISIGVGSETMRTPRVSTNEGTAYIRSGERFKQLTGNEIVIQTEVNRPDLNFTLHLFNLLTNKWTPSVASILVLALEHSGLKQLELAQKIGKTQRYISETLKQGHFAELKQLSEVLLPMITQQP